jgi:hypothetical protein
MIGSPRDVDQYRFHKYRNSILRVPGNDHDDRERPDEICQALEVSLSEVVWLESELAWLPTYRSTGLESIDQFIRGSWWDSLSSVSRAR